MAELLTLGSIVYLEGGVIPLMIVMRQPVIDVKGERYYLDYAGINQMVGLEPEKISYFNNENISEVIFKGYVGDNEQRIQKSLSEWGKEHPEVRKGNVDDIISLLKD